MKQNKKKDMKKKVKKFFTERRVKNNARHYGVQYPKFSKGAISIVIISDLHCGSIKGACSSRPVLGNKDSHWEITDEQKEVRKVLTWGAKNLRKRHIDVLIINGEGIDGENRHQHGNQSWTSDPLDMVNDVVKLLHELFEWEICYVSRGSKYHVQVGATDWDEILAEKLGAVYNSPHSKTSISDDYGLLRINGLKILYAHHISYSPDPAGKGRPLSKELANCNDKAETRADFQIRSHVHSYGEYKAFFEDENGYPKLQTIITTPCCKYPDSFLMKGGMGHTVPDIGFVEIIVEEDGELFINPIVAKPESREPHVSDVNKILGKRNEKRKTV